MLFSQELPEETHPLPTLDAEPPVDKLEAAGAVRPKRYVSRWAASLTVKAVSVLVERIPASGDDGGDDVIEPELSDEAKDTGESASCSTQGEARTTRNTRRTMVSERVSMVTTRMSRVSIVRIFSQRDNDGPSKVPCLSSLVIPGMVAIISVVTCGLAFSAIPASNPLQDPGHSHWWHCALACGSIWAILTNCYLYCLLQEFLYKPYDKRMKFREALLVYFFFTLTMVAAMLLVMQCWVNPAPLNGVTATLAAMSGAGFVIFFVLIPRLGKELADEKHAEYMSEKHPMWKLKVRGIMVIVFNLLSAVIVMAMLVWSTFLLRFESWAVIVGISAFRISFCVVLETIARYMVQEAVIVGINLVLVSVGMANVIAIGNSGDWRMMTIILVIDIFWILRRIVSLGDIEIRGVRVSEMFLVPLHYLHRFCLDRSVRSGPDPDQDVLLRSSQKQLSHLLASEISEVAVPLAFVGCWFIVYLGPNKEAFSGNGTSDFGLVPPRDALQFFLKGCILVVMNVLSCELLKFLLKKLSKVDLDLEAQALFRVFGPLLIVQTCWVVVTSFCMTMIQCGLDYSLKYTYMRGG